MRSIGKGVRKRSMNYSRKEREGEARVKAKLNAK